MKFFVCPRDAPTWSAPVSTDVDDTKQVASASTGPTRCRTPAEHATSDREKIRESKCRQAAIIVEVPLLTTSVQFAFIEFRSSNFASSGNHGLEICKFTIIWIYLPGSLLGL